MQYQRLTQEQFEALHLEFAQFLAANGIDKAQWEAYKTHEPTRVESMLDAFSDLIWDTVLQQTQYLIHYDNRYIFAFHCLDTHFESIIVHVDHADVDLTQTSGLTWLEQHWKSPEVNLQVGRKKYVAPRPQEMFALIQQGAQLHDGLTYQQLYHLIHPH